MVLEESWIHQDKTKQQPSSSHTVHSPLQHDAPRSQVELGQK